ncbi:hypothetical protein HYW36_01505 [Candidatus Saccharibacteria bacterium]|nr:hypothetical protein [Candidatus Saccharibacteria bacterium]
MAKIKTSPRGRSHDHPFRPRKVSTRAFNRVYWPYLPVIFIIGILLFVGVRQESFQSVLKKPSGSVLSYASSMRQDALLADTNKERARQGLPILTLNDRLDLAAQAKAQDMTTRDYWSHKTPDGQPPWIFVAQSNYTYQKLGENLAAGFENERSTINGWMASQTHKANILDPNFSDVGFGIAQSANYTSAGGGPMTIVVAFYGKGSAETSTLSNVRGDSTPSNVSLAQLAVAELPIVSLATNLATLLAIGAIGIWVGRHFLILKRALAAGEKYAIKHPLLDIGLITIAALSYLLTRTVGLIH